MGTKELLNLTVLQWDEWSATAPPHDQGTEDGDVGQFILKAIEFAQSIE